MIYMHGSDARQRQVANPLSKIVRAQNRDGSGNRPFGTHGRGIDPVVNQCRTLQDTVLRSGAHALLAKVAASERSRRADARPGRAAS
jgi:hypothetical protein